MSNELARTNMLKQQLRTWHVLDAGVLDLLATTPRELFVPKGYERLAFADTQIPVARGRTMMSPGEEGRAIQALAVKPTEKVLLIGIEGGYLMTLLAKQALHVYGVETDADLQANADAKIQTFKLSNVSLIDANINGGWEQEAPFDVVVLSGSVHQVPQPLLDSLTVGGRIYAVEGDDPAMSAVIIQRNSDTHWNRTRLFETQRPRVAQCEEPSRFSF